MPDATEYTIASIDASNGTAGFDSGEAFRPTVNSYMYGNAMAIARIAAMKGDVTTNKIYLQCATDLKRNVEESCGTIHCIILPTGSNKIINMCITGILFAVVNSRE
jgi:Mannosylglycerate hydrolase MGH1-like glycoside hydrolase domain